MANIRIYLFLVPDLLFLKTFYVYKLKNIFEIHFLKENGERVKAVKLKYCFRSIHFLWQVVPEK